MAGVRGCVVSAAGYAVAALGFGRGVESISPRVTYCGDSARLLRDDQRLAQFAESESRVANRTITPDGRELPPRYRAWEPGHE